MPAEASGGDHLTETRRREFCGGCEAGVPHDCERGAD